jgi:transaldolase
MIETGKLKEMINLGLRGMTSNPTIFDKAISSGTDYDEKIIELCNEGKSTFEIYDELTVRDVQDAADILLSVYRQPNGLDGYVSLEINPKLAYKTEETIEEGRRLYKKVNRPNLMFKVPSTLQGFKAIEELIASGISVNVTLIFSLEQYINTANAYMRGIKRLIQNKGDAKRVCSVASVFVSRIDTYTDNLLDSLLTKEKSEERKNLILSLKGKAAVANSHLIYKEYSRIFSSDEFRQLQEEDVSVQRLLWGSTSTKNPNYSDIKYVTELMGKNTVNTMPLATFNAFLDHGRVKETLTPDASSSQKIILTLRELGIDINEVCNQLLKDGVLAFEKSFDSLLSSIEKKTKAICRR